MIDTTDKNKKMRGDEEYELILGNEEMKDNIMLEEGMID